MQSKGLFITFEGGEGAGKTTLIESITKWLTQKKLPFLKTREPGGTDLGEAVRELVLHRKGSIAPLAELSLFLASRAQHVAELIQPALHAGKTVLCDRFNDSTIAYQGGARGLGLEKIASFCKFITNGLEPNLTLYLDIDPEEGLRRAQRERSQDRIESEAISFHTKIREAYLEIHRKEPRRFQLLDASKSPETLLSHAKTLIESFWDKHVCQK